jgi:hypothetical protein
MEILRNIVGIISLIFLAAGVFFGALNIFVRMRRNTDERKYIDSAATQVMLQPMEDEKMDILEEKTNDLMDELNQEWVNTFNAAIEKGEVDMSGMFAKYSQIQNKLKKEFLHAKERSFKQKKKGVFG